jgi:hypothetical protein
LKNEIFIVSDKKLIEFNPSENLEELRSFWRCWRTASMILLERSRCCLEIAAVNAAYKCALSGTPRTTFGMISARYWLNGRLHSWWKDHFLGGIIRQLLHSISCNLLIIVLRLLPLPRSVVCGFSSIFPSLKEVVNQFNRFI